VADGECLDGLRRLMGVCPPPGGRDLLDSGRAGQGGLDIPDDYRRLLGIYGPGCFDEFLWVFAGGVENGHLDILERSKEVRSILGRKVIPILQDVLDEFGATVDDLVQWGITDNADLLVWIAKGSPEDWPTLIVQAGQLNVFVSSAKATETLVGLLTGSMRPGFFPEDFPSDSPRFSVNPYN
jgi:hypothetical protein